MRMIETAVGDREAQYFAQFFAESSRRTETVNRMGVRSLAGLFLLFVSVLGGAEQVKVQHAGLTLNANLERIGDRWAAGPVVLMIHSSLAHSGTQLINALQKLLKDRGISSLAITLSLGLNNRLGFYDCLTPHRHKHTDALDEIGAWIGWLRARGVEDIVLLGHERGGDQAAWFAAERDDPTVKGVVLVAPQTWNPEQVAADYQRRYGQPLEPLIKKARALVEAGQGEKMFDHVDFLYCPDTRTTAASFLSYYGPDPRLDTPTLLPKIKKPVLVVVGTDDALAAELQRRVRPIADGKHIRLAVIEGGDGLFRDLYAKELTDKIVRFVEAP
jgi:pimeloyl-ACP methyl ester carboxylesterase